MAMTIHRPLSSLLQRLGLTVDEGRLRALCEDLESEGPETLKHTLGPLLQKLKIVDYKALLLPWARFDQRALPGLLWCHGQWHLVEQAGEGALKVTDSEGNPVPVTETLLADARIVWLRPEDERSTEPAVTTRSPLGIVLSAFGRQRRAFVEIVIATLVVNALAVMTSLYAMQVYDRVVPTFAYATLTALTAGMCLVVALDWLLKMIRARLLDHATKRIDLVLSQQVYEHLLKIEKEKLPKSLGTLAAQVSGLDSVRQFLSSTLVFTLVDLPFVLLFIAVIWVIGGPVALVYLMALLGALLLGLVGKYRMKALQQQELMRSQERQGLLVETVQGLEVIQSTHSGWRFAKQWSELNQAINAVSMKSKWISGFTTITTGSLASLTYLGAIVVGVFQIEAGALTLGGLLACSILGARVIGPVSQGVQLLTQLQQVQEALGLVSQLLSLPVERRGELGSTVLDRPPTEIQLESVRFGFEGDPVVRLDIKQLRLRAGDRVVLLGQVGSGKTTLLKHLAGLMMPTQGVVRIDHVDLRTLASEDLAQYVGYLPQEVQLFKGTLRSNLAMAHGASEAELMALAAALGIQQFADKHANKMDMPIHEGGQGLSIGQRQLVGLARVMLAKPAVWLLDEPTAALDSETELAVIKQLMGLIQPQDIVVIATHRRSFLNLSNRVLIMHEGSVVQDQAPEALLQTPSRGANA